jgi:cobyrinic acid a,c-diamide synthase|tara:strand:+ start:2533 stop:3798 length:1266 start_codon:yes stop_codon:yes gene_type:complete
MIRFLIASPHSGAGKTVITLAIMRLLRKRAVKYQPAKSGPDYIDPKFHEVASGENSVNLDAWAMRKEEIETLAGSGNLIVEGAMGLFDGAGVSGVGSSADLAKILSLPVVLVIDSAKTAHSIAALVQGFKSFDNHVTVAGVILNRVASDRHLNILSAALSKIDVPLLGFMFKSNIFSLSERHLGLVQASENQNLEHWIDTVAEALAPSLDLETLTELTSQPKLKAQENKKPPGQRIAVARDVAFEFSYPHHLRSWRLAGASISFFSPVADEAVAKDADFIFLPGGYPELHAGQIAAAQRFKSSIKGHAANDTPIYGECGGYMTLGDAIIDEDGVSHEMLGLLNLETSFADRKLHLGYRQLSPLGPHFEGPLRGHEFHYASTLSAKGFPLFSAKDADNVQLPNMGLCSGQTFGSFAHIISGI